MSARRTYAHAHNVWRMTRHIARAADKMFPYWWNSPAYVDELFYRATPTLARCWTQHIRQRKGL